jgi:hypothetical protein
MHWALVQVSAVNPDCSRYAPNAVPIAASTRHPVIGSALSMPNGSRMPCDQGLSIRLRLS